MAPHYCRICSAFMSANDGHRECPMCLGAAHILVDVDNPCSAACGLSRGERQRRATLICGHTREGLTESRRSPVQPPPSSRHGRKRRHKRGQQRESPHRRPQGEAPSPAKRPTAASERGSTESLQILSALRTLSRRMDRLEGHRGLSPSSLPPGEEGTSAGRPVGHDAEEVQSDVDVLSLYAPHMEMDYAGEGDDPGKGSSSGSVERTDRSLETEEVPVSSLLSRVLSAANILGLAAPTPAPAPTGGIWEGVLRATPLPPMPVPDDYATMLRSSWGELNQQPQYNAGCRQLATASYPAETGLGDMPPVEPSMAALTSLGVAGVSANSRCPRKECAKTDRLVIRTFNAAARAARMGNALAITLAALRRTLSPDDQDARALVDAALSSHSQLTRDMGDAMGSAVLCRRQVWLAQTSLPEAIKQELLILPVAPGHVFHPSSQETLDSAERTAASRAAPYLFRGQSNICTRPGFNVRTCRGSQGATSERGRCRSTAQRTARWVLQQVFYCAKKRRRSSARSRPQAPQSVPRGAAFQDGPHKGGDAVHPSRGMVHIYGPEGCLFSRADLPGTQALSSLCPPGQGVPVPGPPLRPFSFTTRLHSHGVSRPGLPPGSRSEDTAVFRRLAHLRPLPRAGGARHRDGSSPHSIPGLHRQSQEEQPATVPTGRIPRLSHRLGQHFCFPDPTQGGQLARHAASFPLGRSRHRTQSPEAAGPDVGSSSSSASGPAEGTPPTALVQCFPSSPEGRQSGKAACIPGLHPSPAPLEGSGVPAPGCPTGGPPPQKAGCLDGRVPDRLGSCLGRTVGEGHMAAPVDVGTHKCPGVEGHSSRPAEFPAGVTTPTRSGENGQYSGSVPRQSPRGNEVPAVSPGGGGTTDLGLVASLLPEGSAHPKRGEQGGRHSLQDGTTPGRMEVEHRGREPDLEAVWDRTNRSLCVGRDDTLPGVVLPQGAVEQFEPGCSGTRVANKLVVRFSSTPAHSAGLAEDQGGPPLCPVGGAAVASEALVPSPAPAAAGAAMAVTAQGRPSVTGRRADLAPEPRGPPSVGPAPTEPITDRLNESVQDTLRNARAPSTRASYALRWRIFSEWCAGTGLEPAVCPVPHVLRFSQLQLDQGKAASTVKVYASAISAFHHGVDNGSLGRHPLVSQFLRGARRLRPGRTLRAPSWDLPTVLNSLTVGPYEPILNADLRSLSLKTAFLLALCSAKRVGELCALSVSEDCLRWQAGGTAVSLWPNPAFLPKVLNPQSINQVLEVSQFQPPSTSQADMDRLLTLCPVRALRAYLARTQSVRKTHSQLFVCYGAAKQGLPLSKQRLSQWLVEVIAHAYTAQGMPVPVGTRAHSTRGVATSWAALRGVAADDICAAASWSTPCTFTRFYRVDVTRPTPVGDAALMSMAEREVNH